MNRTPCVLYNRIYIFCISCR